MKDKLRVSPTEELDVVTPDAVCNMRARIIRDKKTYMRLCEVADVYGLWLDINSNGRWSDFFETTESLHCYLDGSYVHFFDARLPYFMLELEYVILEEEDEA